MARDREYTPHQRGIIRRYYENRDNLMAQKLGEIVSDLWLCESGKKAARLWKSARTALLNAGAQERRVDRICEARDLESLARLVSELF